ncbi:RNA polymerase sigma factor [Paludisphaera rhizosphaerae]|uniref:RNA polymerase sigma factor n=1 Tax=Paludisphaera rhizosphaerae TaxID=2711216 RepID=UPI0013EADA4A|nr:RNA polymerase sigma factor [Paludisphaera rhizosphaerae]
MLRSGSRAGRDVERLLRDGVDPAGGDGPLLRRFLEGRDESAFEAIVDRHGPLVLSLCRRYLRDPADVEDAFQATFLVLVRKGAGLCEAETLAGWLHSVAHRVAFRARSDVLKRRSREGDRDGVQVAPAVQEKPADDSLEVLDGELARLPEKYRAPLVLCYLRGRTHDQAAAELGWPVGTVRSRMAKARSILHERLTRRGLDASACLTAARLDLAAAVVPSSLVAATASAAGRFAGLAASLGWIWRASPSSTTWPAAALAEGVLSTMSTTSWKLLGFAFLSTGLTAGALALTVGPSNEPAKPEEPTKPQAQPEAQSTESALRSVETRLSEVEQKLDRLIGVMMGKPTAAPTAPTAGDRTDAAPKSFDPKGLREIEAELINVYQRYQYTQKLVDSKVVSRTELDVLVSPVRLLVARLRDMEVEARKEEDLAQKGDPAAFEQMAESRYELDKATQAVKEAVEFAKKVGLQTQDLEPPAVDQDRMSRILQNSRKVPDREAALLRYQQAKSRRLVKEQEYESIKYRTQKYKECKAHTEAIQRLIGWAKNHFKDVELTIEDLEKAK